MGKWMFMSTKACKPTLVITQNEIINMKKHEKTEQLTKKENKKNFLVSVSNFGGDSIFLESHLDPILVSTS